MLANVMIMKGILEYIRSDSGSEFVAKDLRKWLADTEAKTLYIESGSPWERTVTVCRSTQNETSFSTGKSLLLVERGPSACGMLAGSL